MLALFIMIICILLLGGLVVLCYLYLRCGLGRPRLTNFSQWRGRWPGGVGARRSASMPEPIQPTTNDESLLLAVDVLAETSRQARLVVFLLLTGFLLSILLLLLALGTQP
ncbi:hypothetical protein [Thermogemmatispora sp.]|uniref:hypothetical protein n=1 Tax=Thermogemmatispora sp. TaxID=1968838 RepID=UPI001D24C770|nr:hypothetical protein [Thermogemmatispora sp.]MBX5448731.1 hypothetical protein [Thermogemmatispora sp.]